MTEEDTYAILINFQNTGWDPGAVRRHESPESQRNRLPGT